MLPSHTPTVPAWDLMRSAAQVYFLLCHPASRMASKRMENIWGAATLTVRTCPHLSPKPTLETNRFRSLDLTPATPLYTCLSCETFPSSKKANSCWPEVHTWCVRLQTGLAGSPGRPGIPDFRV